MHPDHDEFLGVDVGSAKVGIARGSIRARLAEPLMSLKAEAALDKLAELIRQSHTSGLVVGLPRGLDGQETDQTRIIKRWAQQARQTLGLPCFWQDEALTTQKAISYKQSAGHSFDEHAVAAAIILQDFLDTPVKNRVEV